MTQAECMDVDHRSEKDQQRKIRKHYKEWIDETQKNALEDDDILNRSIEQANVYFNDVNKPREAIYDSTLVNLQSHIIKQRTQLLHTNLIVFKPSEFANKLQSYFEKRRLGTAKKASSVDIWSNLCEKSKAVIRPVPTFHFLFGTFEPGVVELKKRSYKARNKDELSSVIQRPKLVDANESRTDQQATEEAEKILSILMRLCEKFGGPICYFEFVTNPESFSETVENMFYVSILVKEAAVRIFCDSQDLPVIEPISHPDEMKATKLYRTYTQCILSISEQEWKDIVREFKISKPKIPTRKRNVE